MNTNVHKFMALQTPNVYKDVQVSNMKSSLSNFELGKSAGTTASTFQQDTQKRKLRISRVSDTKGNISKKLTEASNFQSKPEKKLASIEALLSRPISKTIKKKDKGHLSHTISDYTEQVKYSNRKKYQRSNIQVGRLDYSTPALQKRGVAFGRQALSPRSTQGLSRQPDIQKSKSSRTLNNQHQHLSTSLKKNLAGSS